MRSSTQPLTSCTDSFPLPSLTRRHNSLSSQSSSTTEDNHHNDNEGMKCEDNNNTSNSTDTATTPPLLLDDERPTHSMGAPCIWQQQQEETAVVGSTNSCDERHESAIIHNHNSNSNNTHSHNNAAVTTGSTLLQPTQVSFAGSALSLWCPTTPLLSPKQHLYIPLEADNQGGGSGGSSGDKGPSVLPLPAADSIWGHNYCSGSNSLFLCGTAAAANHHADASQRHAATLASCVPSHSNNSASPFLVDRRDTAQRDADRRVARALLQWTERYDAFAQRAAGNTYYGFQSEKQQGISDCCKTALGGGSGNGGNMMNPDTAKKLRIASIENNRELQALWRVASTEHLIERALRLARSTSSPRIQTTLTALRFFMAITAGYQLNPEICCEQRAGGALSVYVRMCQQFVIRSGSSTGGTRQSQSPSPSIRSPFFAKGMMLDAAGLGASQVSNFSLGSSSSMRQHKVTSVHPLSWLHELLRLTHKWMRELPEAALLVLPMLITTTTAPDEDDSSTTPSLLLSAAVKASEAHRSETTLLELFLRHILQWVPQPQLSSEGGLSVYASFSSKSLKMAMREHERSAAALTEYVCILRRLLDSDAHFATEGSQLNASLPSSKSATGIAGSNNNNNNNNYRHKSTTSSSSALQMKLRLVRVLVRGGSAYSTMQQTATSLNSSINNHTINNNNNWFQSLLCVVTDTIYRVMQNTPNTNAMTTDSSHRQRHQNSTRSPLALSRCRSGSTSSANSSSSVFTTTGGNCERAVHVGVKLHLKLIDEAMELLTSMLCTMVSCSASSCCTTDAGCFPQQQQQQHTAADEIDLSDWLAFVNSIMNSRILEALVELLQNKRVVSISSSSRVVIVRWMCALLLHTPTVIANGSMNAMTSSGGGGEVGAAMHFSTYPQNCLWCTRGLWPLLGALLTEGSAAAELVLGVSYAAGGGSADNTSKPFVSLSASRTAKQEHWSPLHYVSHHVAPPSPSAAATTSRGNRWTSGAAMGSMSASGSSLEEVAEARANTRIPSLCCEELGAVDVLQSHRSALECYVCAVAATQHITGQLGSLAPASRQQEGNECNNSSDGNQATPSSSPSTLASMARKKWIERQIKRCGALAAIAQMLQNISGPFSSYGEVYSRGRTDAEGTKLEICLLPVRHSDAAPSVNAITSHVALESSFNSSCHIPSAREAHETVTRQDAALLRQLLAAERAGVSVLLHCFQHMPHARRALLDNSACDTGALLIHYTSHLCGAYLSETLHEEFIGALEDALRALSLLCREDAEVSPQDRVVVGCKTTVQLIVDAGLVPELAKLISRPLWSCRHIPLAALDTLEEVLTSPRLSSRCRLRIVTESRFLVPSLVSTITGKDWEVLMEQWMSINSTGVAGPRDVQHTTCCPRGIPHALQAYVLIQRSLQVGALRLLRRWLTSPVVVKRLGCDEDDGVLDFSVTSPVRTSSSMTLMQQQVDLQRRSGATTSVFTGLSPSNEQHASASCSSRGGQRWDYVTPLLDSPHLINFLVATLKREHVDHMFPSSSPGRCASAAPEGANAGRSSSTAATLSGRGGGGSSSSNINNNNNNNGTGTSRPMYEHYNNPSSRVYPQRFHAYAYRASPPHSGASNVIDARPTPSPIPSGGGSSGTEAASSQSQSQVCRHEDERRQHQRRVLREVLQLIQAMPNAPSDGSTPTKERRFRDDNWSKLFVKVSKLFDALLARKVMQTCYSSSCSHEVNPHSAPVNIINHNNNINFNNNNNNHNNNTLELEEQALLLLTLQALMRFFPPFYLSGGLSAIANHRDPRQQLQCLSGITTSSLSTPLRVAVAASSSSSHDTRDTNRVHQYRLGEQGSTAYIRQLQELVVQHISFPVLDSLVSAWSSSSTAAAASSDGANNNNNTESRACTCPSSSAGSGAASCCAAEHDLLLGTLPMLWVLVRVAKDGSTTAV